MKRICNRGSISVLRILSLLSLFVSFNCPSDSTGCFGEDSSRMDDVLRDNSSSKCMCICVYRMLASVFVLCVFEPFVVECIEREI